MRNEDKDLWDLLGRAEHPAAPPFFAAKIMRRIGGHNRPGWRPSLLRWLAPATVAALVAFALIPQQDTAPASTATADLSTLDLVEMLSPDDYIVLSAAGWNEDNSLLAVGP